MPTFIFTIAFLNKFFYDVTRVNVCKRPEVNTEPTHFLTFMNNGKTFSSLDGMECSYQWHCQAKRHWISRGFQKPSLLEHKLKTRNNMKSQIKNKKNGSTSL